MAAASILSGVANTIYEGAKDILAHSDTPAEIAAGIARLLTKFITWPYVVGPVSIRELEAAGNSNFPAVIYTSSTESAAGAGSISSTRVACVFHVAHTLTTEELKEGYGRIGAVKRLRQSSPKPVGPLNDVPLGVIFCIDSSSPLETIAQDVIELNKGIPSTEWPDMIVVLRRGTVNYAVQFEGDKIGGDFLLPNRTDVPVFPLYVHVFARALGLHSLNRLFGFLFLQLQTFSPGVKLPNHEALQGISMLGMTLGGYQFNLKGELVPVPDEMRTDKGAGLRNLPFRIETRGGDFLSHVQFIPWQEGGVIRVIGKMPLEMILVYLGPVMKNAQRIEQKGARISSVLPITREDFANALKRFQAQSNMIVKPEQPKWIVSKIADEGSSTPFIARLFMGVMQFRDDAFPNDKEKEAFDKSYESTLAALSDARSTAKEIHELVNNHREKVSTGKGAHVAGRAIHIDSIDKELRKHIADFTTAAGRSLKQGMQSVAKILGIDIGFLFKNQTVFEKGLAKLSTSQPELADYLKEARSWAAKLNLLRNKIEHEGWLLPRVGYRELGGNIEMLEPEIEGVPVSQFVRETLDRLCCFAEEVTVFGLRTRMDPEISITEIPLSQRDPSAPERFRRILTHGGTLLWKLAYHTRPFDQV
jgi:hypothetical protein